MFYVLTDNDTRILECADAKENIHFKPVKELKDITMIEYMNNQDKYGIINGELVNISDTDEYKEKKAKEERERLDNLSMKRGDVFEALILAKNLGKPQIRKMIENAELDATTKLLYLNRFDEAIDFYRGYPIFELLGEQLDITPQMLDEFFETKDYTKLIKVEEDLNSGEEPIEGATALVEPEESEEEYEEPV